MSKNNKKDEEILKEEKNTSAETVTNDAVEESTDKKAEAKTESEVEKLKGELDAEKDKYLRMCAEYDNFRRRSAKEKLDIYTDATSKIIGDILPIYDNFERALQSDSTDETFKKGTEMIFNQFTETLKKLGIEIINPVGEEFDPNFAQAINQIEDDNYGENIVAQVFQKGYKMGDKVIRYAMVVVANP